MQINGIATVRAFGTERFFVDKVYKRLDRVQAASYYCTLPPLAHGVLWLPYVTLGNFRLDVQQMAPFPS